MDAQPLQNRIVVGPDPATVRHLFSIVGPLFTFSDTSSRVLGADWVIGSIFIRLERLFQHRIHAQELARLRVVVAPDYVVTHRPATSTSAAPGRVPRRDVAVATGCGAAATTPSLTN